MEEMIRAFIALEFPDEVVKEIARLQGLLGNKRFTGKLTELGNLHLTLKFLGEISGEKLEEVQKVLSEIKFNKFEAVLSGAGTFSYRKSPRIVWVKIGGKAIFNLQAEIDLVLEKIGVAKENRFMSHLTLARIKYVKDKQSFVEYVDNFNVKKIKFNVSEFYLKKSDLNAREKSPTFDSVDFSRRSQNPRKPLGFAMISGPVYTNLESYSLQAM